MRPGLLPVALAGLAATAALALPAGANGRPPVSNGVFFRPGDPHSIYVRSTFGLLVSHDDGCSFRWVCEQAIGYGGQFDPKYAASADGTLFATTFTGLRVSRDGGCTWRTATAERPIGDPGRIAGVWVDALDLAPDGDVWVATAESGKPNDVYRSTDHGETFAPRGLQSPTIWWKSIRVAPSRAQRVYITGYEVMPQPRAHLRWSDDRGETWTPSALAGVVLAGTPIVYAVAVDPANPDIVFVVSLGANPPIGDRLYRSTDGGATLTEVLVTTAGINSVVHHGGAIYASTIAGSYQSGDGGATFTPMTAPPQLACLGSHAGALVGCGANWEPDFKSVARSTSNGASWDKLFRFVELAGPLGCAPGTTAADMCDPMWPGLQQQFGATGPTTGTCAAPPDLDPPPKKGGGCCSADAGAPRAAAPLAAAVLALVLRRRRRRPASAR